MMMKHAYLPLILIGLLFGAGCDSLDTNVESNQEYVVESYLTAGAPFQQVRLSRTSPIENVYDFTALAVKNATVSISLLRNDGSIETTYTFSEVSIEPGVYRPDDALSVVEPLRTYALDVRVGGRRITAQTIIPDEFELVETNLDTLIYQSSEQLEINVTRSFYPGRQNIFIFLTEALEPTEANLTPFLASILGDNPDENDLADLASSSSPLLNEANYDVNPDGTITIKYPWLALAFLGSNRLTAYAVDDNVFDFIRSHFVQQGGSTLSPGEIPNVIDHINGGVGIFGSYAKISVNTFIKPAR